MFFYSLKKFYFFPKSFKLGVDRFGWLLGNLFVWLERTCGVVSDWIGYILSSFHWFGIWGLVSGIECFCSFFYLIGLTLCGAKLNP
uniref:Uncharacterized protein n=1 Tax=Rhizophora mucronata TaxID=61149 RepID=A0A2P2PGI8_RHIMU